MKKEIAVIGAGRWGTTLANLLAKKGYPICIWDRRPKIIENINEFQENKYYLPQVLLSSNIKGFKDFNECVSNKEIVIIAVASEGTREIANKIKDQLSKDTILVIATKGISEGFKTNSQIYEEIIPKVKLCVLSGPNLALEIVKEMPTATVVASKNMDLAKFIQNIFFTPYFRTYTQNDVLGVELGGALKNIYALGCGINDGLSFGANSRSTFITRGLAEMIRLGVRQGANQQTFYGLSGLGDLIATGTSTLSRNYQVGWEIAKKKKIKKILSSRKMVTEGIPTLKATFILACKYHLDLPIVQSLYNIIYEVGDLQTEIKRLMSRSPKKEEGDYYEEKRFNYCGRNN